MNAKLLTDEALKQDIDTEMMFTRGSLAYFQMHPDQLDVDAIIRITDKQVELLIPVIKKHIKRHVKAARPSSKEEA